MKYFALVPVKALALAKSRLAEHLSQRQRETLVLDMLYHVVHTLCDSEAFEQVYVVSADSRVLELIQHWGAEALRETQPGHNPALHAAALTILERAAWRQGVHSVWQPFRQQGMVEKANAESTVTRLPDEGLLTISADLPLLTPEDIQALIQEAENHQIVLAGSSDGTGTNALLTRPPLVVPYLFGPHSLPAYIRAARTRQISYALYHHPHLAFDIDTREDLQKLERSARSWSCTASFAT
jgi:2-phospho-L-lactate/phosphoenolpyruvate guanylyltransferase